MTMKFKRDDAVSPFRQQVKKTWRSQAFKGAGRGGYDDHGWSSVEHVTPGSPKSSTFWGGIDVTTMFDPLCE